MALLEALLAFIVLALGTMSVMRIQTMWGAEAAIAQQRSQALRLGQREIESVRAFAASGAGSGVGTFDDIVSASSLVEPSHDAAALADYRLTRTVVRLMDDRARSVDAAIEWSDRGGGLQRVTLQSVIARSDPFDSAALQVGSRNGGTRGAQGRAPTIPLLARDLGHGRSAIRLASGDAFVMLLDNRSGAVVARCAVDPHEPIDELTDATLGTCTAVTGQLLSGVVRFAPNGWSATDVANGAPLPLDIALELSGGPDPATPCRSEAMKAVAFMRLGVVSTRSVPLDAVPASVGVASWVDTGDRFVAYRCVVPSNAAGTWSGRSRVVPGGWTIGRGTGDRRVCRYVTDLDHNGAIDRNAEHPAVYVDVVGALTQQNFLVLRGDLPCPVVDGDAALHAAITTEPHQP